MKIIDFRLRPPFGSFTYSPLFTKEVLSVPAELLGSYCSQAALQQSMELLIQEMDEANIVMGVTPIRKTTQGENEDIEKLEKIYPGRFAGFAWIDPLNTEEAIEDIDKYVNYGAAYGITLEPGIAFTPEKWFADDKRVFPVYEKCQAENIPILFTYGGVASEQHYYNPLFIQHIAQAFPKLKIVLAHGGFPHVLGIAQVALQYANVYLAPDIYMSSMYPGSNIYIQMANYTLQNQVIFGSVYPGGLPLKAAAEDVLNRLRPQIAEKVMYKNAAKVLGLAEED